MFYLSCKFLSYYVFSIIAIPSLGYEKVCVLFNIAALQSAVAAAQSIENDDGLKLAAKLLQVLRTVFYFAYKSIV